jgi:hypothetical protein
MTGQIRHPQSHLLIGLKAMRLQPTLRVSIVKFKLLDVIPKALVFCFAFR